MFGPLVWGGLDADSDVDFLVDFIPGQSGPFEDFCGLRDELGGLSIVTLTLS